MKSKILILILSALAVTTMLAGCAAVTAQQPVPEAVSCPPPPDTDLRLNEVIRYYSHLRELPAPDIAREYNTIGLNFSKTGSNPDRIKLAILLTLPNNPLHDTAAAIDLLKTLPDSTTASPSDLHEFALLLGMLLARQEQTDEAMSDLAKALATEKAHSKSLQGKIDAIKDFEINQTHRDQP
jgi:hypothetical protein